MTTDFEIEDNHALRYKGQLFDLHNNFDLLSFQNDLETKEFKFIWTRAKGSWVNAEDPKRIELIHKAVSYLFIGDNDAGRLEDDNCLGDVTFYPSSQRDVNENIIDQPQASNGDDILYSFESGRKIRICCEAIELVLG